MRLFNLFTRNSPNKVFIAILLGMVSGFAYTLIIPLLLNVLGQEADGFVTLGAASKYVFGWEVSNYKFAELFISLCLFILVVRTFSQIILLKISVAVATDVRTKIYKQMASSSIKKIENIGPARLMAALTTDVPTVVSGARLLPELLTTSATLIGMLGYLYFLSAEVFWFVMWSIFFGVLSYQVPMFIAERFMNRSREYRDSLHESIRGLIYGIKELKLDMKKQLDYFSKNLIADEIDVRDSTRTGQSIFQIAVNYGNMLSFFIIGAVSFIVVNHAAISNAELVGVIMVLLYISGPIQLLLNFIPQLMISKISLNKLDRLFKDLEPENFTENKQAFTNWNEIRFKQVSYKPVTPGVESAFVLGPVDFTVRRGEITFIVGGNGSGKSTLSKLISLHYLRDSGNIYFGDKLIDKESICECRNSIAVIYSDYYLFSRLLIDVDDEVETKVRHFLKMLELDSEVSFVDGCFSTLALSDGQRRRLALLVSFVENKQLYLFDEWAADQDPKFKKVFYQEILPSLKANNKAVIVISHDDRYFNIADHLIQMEDGKVIRDERITKDRTKDTGDEADELLDLHMWKNGTKERVD